MRLYLAGAIQDVPDRGVGWREEITALLEAAGHEITGPDMTMELWAQLPGSENDKMRVVIRKDLADLDRADRVIFYCDEFARASAGTNGEITYAYAHGIPVDAVIPTPVDDASLWAMACIETRHASLGGLVTWYGVMPEIPIHDAVDDILDGLPAIHRLTFTENLRQLEKWGVQYHRASDWLCVLGEEVGEANEAFCDGDWENFQAELIQVAAVAHMIIRMGQLWPELQHKLIGEE